MTARAPAAAVGSGVEQGAVGCTFGTRAATSECPHEHVRADSNVVRRLYHFGRSVSELARACRLMGEGAYDRLHASEL